MNTFKEANQARIALKMKLSNYGWYRSMAVVSDENGMSYCVLVNVSKVDNNVRKIVPTVFEGVAVKTEAE